MLSLPTISRFTSRLVIYLLPHFSFSHSYIHLHPLVSATSSISESPRHFQSQFHFLAFFLLYILYRALRKLIIFSVRFCCRHVLRRADTTMITAIHSP
ncbi:hypothetical protein C8F01DRAFT_479520 [Mycena amicta]|nr:hypothetical protein C8F01DRAFT_479520 [Mycena amicta]